jgi:hypothetical protein
MDTRELLSLSEQVAEQSKAVIRGAGEVYRRAADVLRRSEAVAARAAEVLRKEEARLPAKLPAEPKHS